MARTPKPDDTLLSYIRVQKDHDRKLYEILNRTASAIDRDLLRLVGRDNIGSVIRREQLQMAKKSILERLAVMMTEAGYTMQALKYDAAAAAIKDFKAYDRVLMRTVRDDNLIQGYLDSARVTSARGIEAAEQRLLGASYRPLAESVYNAQQLNAGVVDRYVETALTSGLSAREFAKGAVSLVKPNVPGGVSYATLRLGRTEINNAFHATAAQRAREVPWITAARWNLSGSHPRPDLCNEYADNDGTGLWDPDDIPAKPHPQCLCFITPEVVSEDDWLDAYFSGAYDSFLRKSR